MENNLIKTLVAIHAEKKHRKVFDKLYQQDYQIVRRDQVLLTYYKLLCKLFPWFRPYLKKVKTKLIQKEEVLTLYEHFLYLKLRRINTDRYYGTE